MTSSSFIFKLILFAYVLLVVIAISFGSAFNLFDIFHFLINKRNYSEWRSALTDGASEAPKSERSSMTDGLSRSTNLRQSTPTLHRYRFRAQTDQLHIFIVALSGEQWLDIALAMHTIEMIPKSMILKFQHVPNIYLYRKQRANYK